MAKKMFLQLRYIIQCAGYDFQGFAAQIDMTSQQLSNRLSGRSPWTVPEAAKACTVLGRPLEDIGSLFVEKIGKGD